MRIAVLLDHLRLDGTQRHFTDLALGLSERGHSVLMISLNDSPAPSLLEEFQVGGVSVEVIGKKALVSLLGLYKLHIAVSRFQPDVLLTALFYSNLLAPLLRLTGATPKVVASIRARNCHYNQTQRWMHDRAVGFANLIVFNSEPVRQWFVTRRSHTPPSLTIHNSVTVPLAPSTSAWTPLRSALGIAPQSLIVGSIGRLERQKGYDILLNAVADVSSREIVVVIAGEGSERTALQSLARTLGLVSRVHLMGRCNNIPRFLEEIDIYVQSSRFEGMPNALMEAMAAGRAVIVTAVDGNLELVVDQENGIQVPPNDRSALATAISQYADNQELRQRLGKAARDRVISHFSPEGMLDDWERALVRLAGSR